VLADSDGFATYPAAVEPAQRQVVHANLGAMLGLALDIDGGRYPSLARFLHRLRGFDALEDREGPSEGRSESVDAVRLMTIHGAKGLEADLVVLADAHHAERGIEGGRLHVDWPPRQQRPTELSFRFAGGLAGRSRAESFAREAELGRLENWNLLYVALTRARRGAIVSGVATARPPERSWYTAFDSVPPPPGWEDAAPAGCRSPAAAGVASFDMRLVELPALDVGERRAPAAVADSPAATELGHALHRALELLTAGCTDADVRAALCAFALDPGQQSKALALARDVLSMPELAVAFAPGTPASNELEILDADGRSRRIDRLACVDGGCWVIDYKWSVDAQRRPDYVEQLRQYRVLVEQLDPRPFGATGAVRTVLVDASHARIEFDPA
jgi:ATP-dependent helicase/nuclease subunit A